VESCVGSRYEIVEKIGEGGCGIVYKARDLRVPRLVALKFIDPRRLGSEQAVQRFQAEAKAVCSLNHPNVVVLHDVDTDPETGRMFLVLEYLPGGTLRQLIQERYRQGLPFQQSELCRCAAAMAAGLAHAHRHDIAHRDVKSSNVMFSEERIVKITDFGLAKSVSGLDLTDRGCNLGTVPYMSPEQARGLEVDYRTDIFSLGIVLYEMATGQLPFSGSSPYEVLNKIVTDPTPSLQGAGPHVPEELDRIVRRATAKDPRERYQRMEELERELLGVQDRLKRISEAPTATNEAPLLPAPRPPVRRRTAVLAALSAALALAALGVFSFRAGRERPEAPPAVAQTLAVVPFQCLGTDDSAKNLCEGLANAVSMALTQLEPRQNRMLVVPYSEVRREGVASAGDAHRLFRAQLAVTGSVQFAGPAVRVIINLVDAENKVQIASRNLDAAAGSLARLLDEASKLTADMLELRLTPGDRQQIGAGQTRNEAAFDAFIRALGLLARSRDTEEVRRAAGLLEEAVGLDPSYALAHAHLGEAYLQLFRKTEDGAWLERAQASSERAIKIGGRLAQPHVAMAQAHLARTDPERAVAELKLALRLDPKSASALQTLGNAYVELGMRKPDARLKQEGVDAFKQSIALRPELWTTYRDLGLAYLRMGELPKAEEQCLRMLEFTESADAYCHAGLVYYHMDRSEDAIAFLRKSIAIRPTPEAYSNLGTVYYYQKRYAELIPNFENALRLSEEFRTMNYRIWGNLAMAYMRTPGLEAKGRDAFKQAIRIAQTRLRASPKDAGTHASLAYYLVRAGDGAGARRHAGQAQELAPEGASVLFRCALVYERLKRRDEALATLGRAIQKGHPMKEVLNAGDLEALRNDPRFQQRLNSGQ
jgi:tetratricopeptide (TPR) repeat protein